MGILNKMKSLFGEREFPPMMPQPLPDSRYHVIPGAVAKQMPAEWQSRLAGLLGELNTEMVGLPDVEYKVTAIDPETRQYTKDPLG